MKQTQKQIQKHGLEVDAYLQQATTPLRLACTNLRGYPTIVALWYAWDGKHFWCVTHKNARLISYLKASSMVGFEVANNDPPYKGLRGHGEAELLAEQGVIWLPRLLERYLPGVDNAFTRWLLGRAKEEVAIKIYPHQMSSWDYEKRMMKEIV